MQRAELVLGQIIGTLDNTLAATALLGASFVGMQAFEWSKLISEGVRPWENPFGAAQFGSTFFMLTGFHGAHVTVGAIMLTRSAEEEAEDALA